MIVMEVKPWGIEVDLDELAKTMMKDIKMEGLSWIPEYKKEPVAYGIFKLIIGCRVEDDKIPNTDDVTEQIEALEDYV